MATYADLKDRIVTELVRDDLNDTYAGSLTTHIARACEYFSDEKFWFNAIVATASTASGVATVSVPASVRRVERVTIPALGIEVREVGLTDLCDRTDRSVPWEYSYYNDTLQFYPVPDAVYSLRLVGLAQIDAPVDDTDENAWTEEAYDLITARVKMTLCRDLFRDPDAVQMHIGAVQEALSRLKRETAQRLETPLRANDYRRAIFDMMIG